MTTTAPTGSHRCRACAADVRDGAPRCERCGAPQGPFMPCPHCRGEGGLSPDPELRFVCDLCGGPRVPAFDASIRLSGREAPLLRKADAARKARGVWRGAAMASGVALVLTVVPFVLLLLMVGVVPLLLAPGVLFTGLFTGLLVTALTRAGARGREIGPAIDGAWVAAADDIAQQSGPALSAQELSQKLGIEEPQAEELLALIDVNAAIGGAPARGPRMRIDAPAAALAPSRLIPSPPVPSADALAQAAEEEAALAAAQVDPGEQRKKL